MAFRQSSPAQPVPQPSPSTIRLDMKLLVETAPELRAALQKFLINNDCVDLAGLQTELSKDHQTALLNWVNAHPGAAQRTMQHEPEPQISMEQVERENREDIA